MSLQNFVLIQILIRFPFLAIIKKILAMTMKTLCFRFGLSAVMTRGGVAVRRNTNTINLILGAQNRFVLK